MKGLKFISGPNIYTNKKVVVIHIDEDKLNLIENIGDEIMLNYKIIGFESTFYKIKNNTIIVEYEDENISDKLIQYSYNNIINNNKDQNELHKIKEEFEDTKLGPSTKNIIDAANKRNIPWFRLNDSNLIQLGQGHKQKRIEASTTSDTFVISEQIVKNKDLTKTILKSIGVPVADGFLINNKEELLQKFKVLNCPVVTKPYDGNHGNGITTNITTSDRLVKGYGRAKEFSEYVIVEKYIIGNDYRVLIIDGKLIAAAKRIPAHVIGDGIHTVEELVKIVNKDPKRGEGHRSVLTKIKINDFVKNYLYENGKSLSYIPNNLEHVYLSNIANLSQGGTAEDVTDIIHQSIVKYCIDTAYQCELNICGLDIICKDITKSLESQNGAIIEVNSGPGLRMHFEPSKGKKRDPGMAIIKGLFKDNGRIPIVAITGVNGKTTTVNVSSYILSKNFVVGKTTTNGVYINDKLIETGDCSGPISTKKVLNNPTIELAVLETARGGLTKGLGFDYCDVGVITMIGAGDHLGKYFNNATIDDIIEIKSIVIKNIQPDGYAVLNANDPYVERLIKLVTTKIIFFSIKKDNKIIQSERKKGNPVIYYDDNDIILEMNDKKVVFNCSKIPVLEHKINFLIENVMSSIAVCIALKTDISTIKSQLQKYSNNTHNNPGRFNMLSYKNSKIILDYAHNIDSINEICKYVDSVNGSKKKLVMYGPAGDREEVVIKSIIDKLYKSFDIVILFVDDKLLRGRTKEELVQIMNGKVIETEKRAIDMSFDYMDGSNCLSILLLDDVLTSIKYIESKCK